MNYEELQNHDKSTTPIHADEVRRTYTSERLQEVIANAELDASALEGRSEQGAYRYKPSVLQTVAATILCTIPLIGFVSYYFMSDEFIEDYNRTIYNIIPNTLLIIGFILLAYKANNKANRIALGIIIFLKIAFLFNLIDESLDAASYYTVQSCWVLIALLQIYSYWLIIENNRLSEKHRVWINLIAVFFIIGIFHTIWLPIIYRITFDNPDDRIVQWIFDATGDTYSRGFDRNIAFVYFILPLVEFILPAIAYWHLARCEAFTGKYDANAKCNYSPLNKWMAAAIIVPLIIAICLFLLYKNYELFI